MKISNSISALFIGIIVMLKNNNIFAPKVAEAFAKTIVAYAYDEAQ